MSRFPAVARQRSGSPLSTRQFLRPYGVQPAPAGMTVKPGTVSAVAGPAGRRACAGEGAARGFQREAKSRGGQS